MHKDDIDLAEANNYLRTGFIDYVKEKYIESYV